MEKNLSSFLQSKINFLILRFMHRRLIYLYLRALGWLYFRFHARQKNAIERAVESVFTELPSKQIIMFAEEARRGLIKHYAEKFHNILTSPPRLLSFFSTRINGRAKIEEIAASGRQGKGVLLLTSHYGGVEYLALYFALLGIPISIVARFSSKKLDELSSRRAKKLRINIINENTAGNIIARIFRDLAHGRIVIFLIDELSYWQSKRTSRSIFFLNKRYPVFAALDLIEKKCRDRRIPACLCFLHRVNFNYYEFMAEKIANGTNQPSSAAEMIIAKLEKRIRSSPENWYGWPQLATD